MEEFKSQTGAALEAEAELDGRPVHWTEASGRAAARAGAGMGLGARLTQRAHEWQWQRTSWSGLSSPLRSRCTC